MPYRDAASSWRCGFRKVPILSGLVHRANLRSTGLSLTLSPKDREPTRRNLAFEKSAYADFDLRKCLVQRGRIGRKSASSPILTILSGVLQEQTEARETAPRGTKRRPPMDTSQHQCGALGQHALPADGDGAPSLPRFAKMNTPHPHRCSFLY
jgi:hypothetical protein